MLHFSIQKKLHTTDGEMQLAIDCKMKQGEFISLYGPSGAGKTSILRMLAGFLKPENGFIKMNNMEWFNSNMRIDVPPQQRKVGFVFQDYALFPNMSVKENIAFALAKGQPTNIVEELLQLTDLTNLAQRKIQTLSGGQQQRVALARAIAQQPAILLLDEPLSAIDNNMRLQLQKMLLQLHKRFNLTTILVSHNIDEIIKLSDKIIHLQNGMVKQYDSSTLFLMGIGYLSGLIGTILSIEENGSINLIMRNNFLNIPFDENKLKDLNKGDLIEIVYDKNKNPLIKKL